MQDLPPPAISQQAAPATYADYATRIRQQPAFSQPGKAAGEFAKPNTGEVKKSQIGPAYYCVRSSEHGLETNLKEYIILDPNSDVIWPGSLVRTRSITKGTPSLVNVPRNPINFWLDIASPVASCSNIQPSSFAVNTALQRVIQQNSGKISAPAKISFDYKELHSVEQALYQLGFKVSQIGGSVAAQLSSRSSSEAHVIIGRFEQIYYTCTYSVPPDGNQYIFREGMLDYETDSLFNRNDPLSYIASVKYGRLLVFKVESTSSADEIMASLDASRRFIEGKVDLKLATQKLDGLKDLKITAAISGGSAEEGLKAITTGDFFSYIRANPEASTNSPGVAVSFVVKTLKDNQLVETKEATTFKKSSRQPLQKIVHVTLHSVKVHNDGDSGFEGAGDFVWDLRANDQIVARETNQRNYSTGETIPLEKTITFNVDYTVATEIRIHGRVTDVDGGTAGPDDPVDFSFPIRLSELLASPYNGSIKTSQRRSFNGDPDLELFFTIKILGDVNCEP